MTVNAWEGDRKLTLDPLLEVVPLEIKPRRVYSSIPCGFQVEWISGEGGGITFGLTAGAGFGSAWMVLTVTMPDGEERQEVVDAREFLPAWVDRIVKTPLPEEGR